MNFNFAHYLLKSKNEGYMAMVAILVMFMIIVSVSTVLAMTSINESYITLDTKNSYQGTYYLDSCLQEVLLRLNTDNEIPTSIAIPGGILCDVDVEEVNEDQYTFRVDINYQYFQKALRVIANRADKIYIISYKQLEL